MKIEASRCRTYGMLARPTIGLYPASIEPYLDPEEPTFLRTYIRKS